ncbi:hypothetical protein CEP51_014447, partial [Fusarium floridanum]
RLLKGSARSEKALADPSISLASYQSRGIALLVNPSPKSFLALKLSAAADYQYPAIALLVNSQSTPPRETPPSITIVTTSEA